MNYADFATPIIGATIGYFTNWVAIKMLFRPYYKKKIFGIKIPFTPGLIPKERERIAVAIGEVVEKYLLTEEVLVKELTNTEIKDKLKLYINKTYFSNNVINIDKLINDEAKSIFAHELSTIIINNIVILIKDEKKYNELVNVLSKNFTDYLDNKKLNDTLKDPNNYINNFIFEMINSDDIKKQFSKFVKNFINEQQQIRNIVSSDFIENLKEFVKFNEPKIKIEIHKLLQSDSFSEQVKEMINEVISQKFGALGAMFVSPDSIYDSIQETISNKVENMEITEIIFTYANKLLDVKISDIMPSNTKDRFIDIFTNKILDFSLIDKLICQIKSSNKSIYSLLNNITKGNIDNSIKKLINEIIDLYCQSDNQSLLLEGIENIILDLMSTPIQMSKHFKEKIINYIIDRYDVLVNNNIGLIINDSRLSTIIKKQINSFPIEMLEEMILQIAKRELRAITWLGALLGLIMSLIILVIK